MNFNPDTTKQAQEVKKKNVHPPLLFDNASVTRTSSQKHLEFIIDNQLKFHDHLKVVSGKIIKTIGLLCKLENFFTKSCPYHNIESFYQTPS